jgi:protein TonB
LDGGDGDSTPGNIAANRTPSGNRGDGGDTFSENEVSCLRNCKPKYPEKLKKIQDTPVVRITITADGKPEKAAIVTSSGYTALDKAVQKMAMRMEFSPPGRKGTLRLTFTFAN